MWIYDLTFELSVKYVRRQREACLPKWVPECFTWTNSLCKIRAPQFSHCFIHTGFFLFPLNRQFFIYEMCKLNNIQCESYIYIDSFSAFGFEQSQK